MIKRVGSAVTIMTISAALGGLALMVSAHADLARAQPARNGDVYNGIDHQPTRAGVLRKEKRAGIAPPGNGKAQTSAVERLDRKLMHDEAVDPPSGSARR